MQSFVTMASTEALISKTSRKYQGYCFGLTNLPCEWYVCKAADFIPRDSEFNILRINDSLCRILGPPA